MLMLKSTHVSILKQLRDDYEKAAATERAHFDEAKDILRHQISNLERLVFVQTPTHAEEHPIRVANAILDGKEVLPKADPAKEAAELEEANRILSGSYDRIEETW